MNFCAIYTNKQVHHNQREKESDLSDSSTDALSHSDNLLKDIALCVFMCIPGRVRVSKDELSSGDTKG